MVCSFGIRGNVPVNLARGLQRWATDHGRRASHAQRMAAHRCAARRGHRSPDGIHRLRICRAKTVVASSRDDDVQLDYYLRVDPWRAEPDSSRDHVARDYQRDGLWLRLGLVFLFQTERRRLFSRVPTAMMSWVSHRLGSACALACSFRRPRRKPAEISGGAPEMTREARVLPRRKLIPAELATLVLFFQPRLQRLEVLGRGAGGDVFAGGFLQNL